MTLIRYVLALAFCSPFISAQVALSQSKYNEAGRNEPSTSNCQLLNHGFLGSALAEHPRLIQSGKGVAPKPQDGGQSLTLILTTSGVVSGGSVGLLLFRQAEKDVWSCELNVDPECTISPGKFRSVLMGGLAGGVLGYIASRTIFSSDGTSRSRAPLSVSLIPDGVSYSYGLHFVRTL